MTTPKLTELITIAKRARSGLDASDLQRLGQIVSDAEQELRRLASANSELDAKVRSLKSQGSSSSSRGIPGFHGPRRGR